MDNSSKTIVISYDDASRMIDFCKTEDSVVSKDFYDWYLNDSPEFFTKQGVLLIKNVLGKNQTLIVSFDASNPDEVKFTSFAESDQSVICDWVFKRQENITLNNVSFSINYLSLTNLRKNNYVHTTDLEALIKETVDLQNLAKVYKKGFRPKPMEDMIQKAVTKGFKNVNNDTCSGLIYFTYALLYYVSKQEPEEITSQFIKELNTSGNKIKSIYKYTGYIDLRNNKTYRPVIKKNPGDPVREYNKHIESWTVRGHYRNTKSGRVWIEPYIKGSGLVEDRHYATVDERELNLTPKVFETTKTVQSTKAVIKTPDKQIADQEKNNDNLLKQRVSVVKNIMVNVLSFFKKRISLTTYLK